MASSHLRVISTSLRLSPRLLSPVVAHKSNVEACITPVTTHLTTRTISRKRLQFPSPVVAVSSSRLHPRSPQIAILENDEKKPTSTHVIPSVSTPDRDDFFKHGLENKQQWNILGRGTYGFVIEAKYRDKNVAVKIISKKRFPGSAATIENEKNALELAHPNIINILNVINDNKYVSLIIMDKIVGVNLQQQLDDNSFTLSTPRRIGYALDISLGIEFCHSKRILHLDIKPKNIVVCFETNTCKLCDFGSSTKIYVGKKVESLKHVNTVPYTAPEILKGKQPTCASDIYSFGITMWQLQSREKPYNGGDAHTIIYNVCNLRLRPRSTQSTEKYTKLYEKCWHQEPSYRPHLAYVIKKLYSLKSTK